MRRGFTFAGLLIGVSIVTLLAVIAISQFLRFKMATNESEARFALKEISTALETYAAEEKQGYPLDLYVLTRGDPPYINHNYIADSPVGGYNYTCKFLDVGGYNCSATPQYCDQTGTRIYTITTGGVFTESDCQQ